MQFHVLCQFLQRAIIFAAQLREFSAVWKISHKPTRTI